MKTRISSNIKAQLVRNAFYLLVLVSICTIPFALGQWQARAPSVKENRTINCFLNPPQWQPGADLPSTGVRMVGVYFPVNGKFYAMGGRSSDVAGSDFTHPFQYDSGSNTWTTKSATYPDNQVSNMACGVLTVSGTPYIYCVGGSAAGQTTATARVFFYDPVSDTITSLTSADNWPGDAAGTILPGGFAVTDNTNKLYILGGFNINVASTNQVWSFDPTAAVGSKWVQAPVNTPVGIMYAPTTAIDGIIYVGGASDYVGGTVIDTTNSFKFNATTNTIGAIAPIPRATGETRALNISGTVVVMGGGRVAPNPSNEVDEYNPFTNTWTIDSFIPAFMTARRNFATDNDPFNFAFGTHHIWVAGGYGSDGTPLSSTEVWCRAVPTPSEPPHMTPTATPTATPTPTPTASPSPTPTPTASPMPPPPCEGRVLIVYTFTGPNPPAQFRSQILAEPGITAVDVLDAHFSTPTQAQLLQYNIVVPFSYGFGFADSVTLGNNLADYVDAGGIVVQYGYAFYGPNDPHGVNGRWVTGNYAPYNYSTIDVDGLPFTLGAYNAGHPLMAGVTMLNSNYHETVIPAAGATQVAATSTGDSLVAYRSVGRHTTVGVTAYVGYESTQSGDWGKVVANAGRWLLSCAPTPTATPALTATVPPSPTATSSPTLTPRIAPTPRPHPNPPPRP